MSADVCNEAAMLLRRAELSHRVVVEVRSWVGTPYHSHARIKGVGVDCAHLLIAAFAAAGRVDEFDPGNYPADWHMHRSEEIYEQWLDRFGDRIERSEATAGDVALFKFGRTFSHGAILVDRLTVVHAYVGLGVSVTRFDESPLEGREVKFWRIR